MWPWLFRRNMHSGSLWVWTGLWKAGQQLCGGGSCKREHWRRQQLAVVLGAAVTFTVAVSSVSLQMSDSGSSSGLLTVKASTMPRCVTKMAKMVWWLFTSRKQSLTGRKRRGSYRLQQITGIAGSQQLLGTQSSTKVASQPVTKMF